jgi:hypothetical protein
LDGLDHRGNQFVSNDQFNLGLRDEINLVFRPPVEFGMSLLPSESSDFVDGHSLHTNLCKGFFYFVQLKWFDYRFDLFHWLSSIPNFPNLPL